MSRLLRIARIHDEEWIEARPLDKIDAILAALGRTTLNADITVARERADAKVLAEMLARTPQNGDVGIGPAAQIIAPGNPAASVLLARMSRRDASAMPPLASTTVDTEGAALIEQWIAGLTVCQ